MSSNSADTINICPGCSPSTLTYDHGVKKTKIFFCNDKEPTFENETNSVDEHILCICTTFHQRDFVRELSDYPH